MYHHIQNCLSSDINFYGHFFRNDKNKYWLAAARLWCSMRIICVLWLKLFEYRSKLHIEMKNWTVANAIAFKAHKHNFIQYKLSFVFFSVVYFLFSILALYLLKQTFKRLAENANGDWELLLKRYFIHTSSHGLFFHHMICIFSVSPVFFCSLYQCTLLFRLR